MSSLRRILPNWKKRSKEYLPKKASVEGEREAVFSCNVTVFTVIFHKGFLCFETKVKKSKMVFFTLHELFFNWPGFKNPRNWRMFFSLYGRIVYMYIISPLFLIERWLIKTFFNGRGFVENGSWIFSFFKAKAVVFRVT